MTVQQYSEFSALAKPLMEWLSKTGHPHVRAIISDTKAELVEVLACDFRFVPEKTSGHVEIPPVLSDHVHS